MAGFYGFLLHVQTIACPISGLVVDDKFLICYTVVVGECYVETIPIEFDKSYYDSGCWYHSLRTEVKKYSNLMTIRSILCFILFLRIPMEYSFHFQLPMM